MHVESKDFVLAVEGLTVSFDGFKAVNDLSFYVDENEIRVIIGPNGAGKTTVLDLICGRTKATEGSIKFRGKELTKMKEHQIVHQGVGRKFQNPSIYEDLTVFENLEISYPKGRNGIGALFFKRDKAVEQKVEEIAEMIFLKELLDKRADLLSHGQKQWLEIGMLLIQDPELLMLDEPVAGMVTMLYTRSEGLDQRRLHRRMSCTADLRNGAMFISPEGRVLDESEVPSREDELRWAEETSWLDYGHDDDYKNF